ncbi:nucleoside 2-deoxyribosyltransferase [Chloroflexota bacterium]
MNIYFACSVTGGREYEAIYQSITKTLLGSGHVVPTAHLADPGVVDLEKIVDAKEIYSRDVNWIRECDLLVAEISTPSHGVGYEICYALSLEKPVVCLHQKGVKVSKMITGNPHKQLKVFSYIDKDQAILHLQSFLKEIKSYL